MYDITTFNIAFKIPDITDINGLGLMIPYRNRQHFDLQLFKLKNSNIVQSKCTKYIIKKQKSRAIKALPILTIFIL